MSSLEQLLATESMHITIAYDKYTGQFYGFVFEAGGGSVIDAQADSLEDLMIAMNEAANEMPVAETQEEPTR